MLITSNTYGNYGGYCRQEDKFSSLPPRKQYQAVEDLVASSRGQDPEGARQLEELSRSLGMKSVAHLSVAIIDASDNLNSPNADSPIEELSKALGLNIEQVDCRLGQYVAELAAATNPVDNGTFSGNN